MAAGRRRSQGQHRPHAQTGPSGKHGRRSGQLRRAIDKLMTDSDTRALLHVFSTLAPEDLPRYQETLTSYTRKYWQRSAKRT